MRFETISYVKQNVATLDLSNPICITQNGLPKMVLLSYEQYQATQEAIALGKLLGIASKDAEAGRLISGEQLLERLNERAPSAVGKPS